MKHHSHTMAGPFSHGHTRFTACRWDMPIFLTPELGALCYLEGGWSTNLTTSTRLSNPFLSCIHPNTNPRQWIQAFLCMEAWRRNFLPMATKLRDGIKKLMRGDDLPFIFKVFSESKSFRSCEEPSNLQQMSWKLRVSGVHHFVGVPSVEHVGWPQKKQPWKIGEGIIARWCLWILEVQMGVVAWVMRNGSLLQCTSRPYTEVMLVQGGPSTNTLNTW